jgi:hypothetical protein
MINPRTAGIDIGMDEMWVSVRADRDAEPVRRFGMNTPDLLAYQGFFKKYPRRARPVPRSTGEASKWRRAMPNRIEDAVAQSGQSLRGMACVDLTAVFARGFVTHISELDSQWSNVPARQSPF